MKTFAQRLQMFMDYKHMSAHILNKAAGLSTGVVRKSIVNNAGIASGSVEQILLAFPELNADWLLTGRGKMLNAEKPKAVTEASADALLPDDIENSLYRTIVWHLLLQDDYATLMEHLNKIMDILAHVNERCSELTEQLTRLKAVVEMNYNFQPQDHGMYEMSLRIAAGDDGKYVPKQLKDHFDIMARLIKHLDITPMKEPLVKKEE